MRIKRFLRNYALTAGTSTDIFSRIYRRNYWGGGESRSGTGSSFRQTEVIRSELPNLLERLEVENLLDAPCGDFRWLSEVPLDLNYVGLDIVPKLIEGNAENYGSERRSFRCADVTRDSLDKFDLILCRDLLVHLSLKDGLRALQNFVDSGSTYLLITTFESRESNEDIRTGDWRPRNLRVSPFSLPEPLLLIDEECTEGGGLFSDKSLGLWELSSIGKALSRTQQG